MNRRKFKKFSKSIKGQNWSRTQSISMLGKMSAAQIHAGYCLLIEHQNGNIDLSDTEKCKAFFFEKAREYESTHAESEVTA